MELKALGPDELRVALEAVGEILESRGLSFDVVIVGGSALALTGVVARPTRDVDVVAMREGDRVVPVPALPGDLATAVADVARVLGLSPAWMNVGPSSLLDLGLPAGFAARLTSVRFRGLTVHIASRTDQIAFKLYAAVDQGPSSRHFADLRALRPSSDELVTAARWTITHDPSPGFRHELASALRTLGVLDASI